MNLSLDLKRSALLSMDYQKVILSNYSKDPEMLPRAAGVMRKSRAAGMRIIHVQVGFRPGMPEISARNPLFSQVKNSPQQRELFSGPAAAIHEAVAPEEGDIAVTKHRVSAFAGTDLDQVLRANEIDTLVLYGVATSGVVLSTLTHASDADYRLIVIKDCCADMDPDLHQTLIEKYFPRRAQVITAAEFLDSLG